MVRTHQVYPVNLSVDYPDRPRNRVTVLFRVFTLIPIAIILTLLVGSSNSFFPGPVRVLQAGLIVVPTILMLLFRKKYPAWWFTWNLNLAKFVQRVLVYFLLLRDEYPSTDEEQAVHVRISYPEAKKDLKRWMPLVKWLLALPHYIILVMLVAVTALVTVIAWFAILFTGKYPPDMFNFVVGTLRWGLRVGTYAFILSTDQYPPFRLED